MKKRYFILVAFLSVCIACKRETQVSPVSFDVISAKKSGIATTTFAVTDTLQFNFNGNPDVITFYSGEVGKRYQYAGRVTATGTSQLQFNSIRANGTQSGSLLLLVSSDFKGIATTTIGGTLTRDTATTTANIDAATWKDITNRATLSAGGTTATSSGVVDLSDFAEQGKPVYIAFKYIAKAGSVQNKWTVSALTLKNALTDGTVYTIANLNASATAIINYGNSTYGPSWAVPYDPVKNPNKYTWVLTAGTSLVIAGAATAATATADAESWAIMGPIDLSKVTPDVGVSIKALSGTLPFYRYNYTAPGSYKAVFTASNVTVLGSKEIVREIPLTLTP